MNLQRPVPIRGMLTGVVPTAAFFMEPSFEEVVDPRDIPSCCLPGQVNHTPQPGFDQTKLWSQPNSDGLCCVEPFRS